MKYVNYIAMSIVNLVMLMATALKLSGNEVALQSFVDLGLASWFGTFIGVCELLGAIYYLVMFRSASPPPPSCSAAFILSGAKGQECYLNARGESYAKRFRSKTSLLTD